MLELRRNFVRFISHEVRTPLNSLTMGLKLVRTGIENKESEAEILETLGEAEGACDIAVEILNEILSYEKIEGGLLTLDTDYVAADKFLDETFAIFIMQVTYCV